MIVHEGAHLGGHVALLERSEQVLDAPTPHAELPGSPLADARIDEPYAPGPTQSKMMGVANYDLLGSPRRANSITQARVPRTEVATSAAPSGRESQESDLYDLTWGPIPAVGEMVVAEIFKDPEAMRAEIVELEQQLDKLKADGVKYFEPERVTVAIRRGMLVNKLADLARS